MEWSREKCLCLIDQYEKHPPLWNPKHGLYYNKLKRHDIWLNIERVLQCPAGEAKKKMDSILSSFRREKAKGTKTAGSGLDRREIYVSKWFAFKRLAFLLDKDEPTDALTPIEDDTPFDEDFERVKVEVDDEVETSTNLDSQNSELDVTETEFVSTSVINYNPFEDNICRKRKRAPDVSDEGNILKNASINNSLKADECDVYGQYVAHKLRSYTRRTKNMIQHHINMLLFKADMGQYDLKPEIQASSPTSSSSVPSPAPT